MDSLTSGNEEVLVDPENESILIVDEDEVFADYLKSVVTTAGYAAASCASATDFASILAGQEVYSLILMENQLNGVTAESLLQQLRSHKAFADVGVIVLQSFPDSENTVSLLEHGADSVLCKPVRRSELMARIKAALRTRAIIFKKKNEDFKTMALRFKAHLFERQQEMESQVKRALYRELVFSFTKGRFLVLDGDEFDIYVKEAFKFKDRIDINSLRSVTQVRMFVDKDMHECKFSDEIIEDVTLCVSEAASNVMKHGGGGFMQAAFSPEDDSYYMLFRDFGSGINEAFFANALFCAGASNKKSFGFGFSIILDIMDSIVMTTSSSGTALLLKKNRIPVEPLDQYAEILERF